MGSSLPISTHHQRQKSGKSSGKKGKGGNFVKKLQIVFAITSTLYLLIILYYWEEVLLGAQTEKPRAADFVSLDDDNGKTYDVLEGGDNNGDASSEVVNIEGTHDFSNESTDKATKGEEIGKNNNKEHKLPEWITNYIQWHRNIRAKYPGKTLLEDPSAPNVLVRICLGLCGGLHDRLGQLPMDLYIANQTQRILLIKWIKPHPLESFLVPPPPNENDDGGLDWRFPEGVDGWGGSGCNTLNECAKQVRAQPSLVSNVGGERAINFDTFLSERLHDLTDGKFKDTKAVTFNLVHVYGENDTWDERLRNLGETDLIYHTPSFGRIFKLFFQPHPDVRTQIDGVYNELALVPGQYDAVHCRVRHPKAYPQGATFKTNDGGEQYVANADKVGMPFEGEFRGVMIQTAIHAVQCAATLPNVGGKDNPMYFMSDSSDLVHYMTHDLYNSHQSINAASFQNQTSVDSKAVSLASTMKLVARDQSIPNAHIDKNKGRKRHEYFGTFVDLYLAINARCVVYGIGNFATFAARISGTSCIVKHQEEKWGTVTRFDASQMCPLV